MTKLRPIQRKAGIIGRTLRLMLGMLFCWMTYTVASGQDTAFHLRILAVFGGVTAFYAVLHFVVSRYRPGLHRWLGAALALIPLFLVFAFGGSLGRLASAAYIGISLVLQAIRADGGCEVLSIPAVFSRRNTHLAGLLFSPVDLVEDHLTGPGGLPG